MFFLLIHLNNNMLLLKVCNNHRVLTIMWRLLVYTNHWATALFLGTDVFKKSWNYTNILGSVMTNNNSKIFLKPLWFLLLKDSLIALTDLPCTQQQSRNQVLENHCVFSLTYYMWKRNLLNQSASQLKQEIRHGKWKQSKNEIQKSTTR